MSPLFRAMEVLKGIKVFEKISLNIVSEIYNESFSGVQYLVDTLLARY